jgi:class 3 adenylate cyclase
MSFSNNDPARLLVTASFTQPVVCPVLVGRTSHLDALHQIIDRANDGQRQTILIAGEAGVGKSRLVAEAKAYATLRGFSLLQGACFPQDSACPYAPFLDLLRSHFAKHSAAAIIAAVGHVPRTTTAATLPSGTVTFLFTDIEGSTQLWERHPNAMKLALARHDTLLRQAIQSHGGYVFKTVGDAFCAAFAAAPAALAAALAAQRVLHAETWSETPINVRMALHTGNAEERDGDYFGPPLNRVARLLSAGHGGQTLLSAATQGLVRNHLPEGIRLRDMGEWRLKDLARPEHIFQLLAPDLPADFPPLKTLDVDGPHVSEAMPHIRREQDVEPFAPALLRLLPGLVRLPADIPALAALDPEQERQRLFAALAEFFTRKAAQQPLLLIVEDLHWSDEGSLDFLIYLLRRSANQPLILIGTYRSDEVGPRLGRWLAQLDREHLAQELSLTALTRDEIAAMLRATFALDRRAV